jgi:hypothetical protein
VPTDPTRRSALGRDHEAFRSTPGVEKADQSLNLLAQTLSVTRRSLLINGGDLRNVQPGGVGLTEAVAPRLPHTPVLN